MAEPKLNGFGITSNPLENAIYTQAINSNNNPYIPPDPPPPQTTFNFLLETKADFLLQTGANLLQEIRS